MTDRARGSGSTSRQVSKRAHDLNLRLTADLIPSIDFGLFVQKRLSLDFCYQLGRLYAQRARDFDEFEHIHLAFTGFELPDERVRPFELCCQLPLRESRRLSRSHHDAD